MVEVAGAAIVDESFWINWEVGLEAECDAMASRYALLDAALQRKKHGLFLRTWSNTKEGERWCYSPGQAFSSLNYKLCEC